VSNTGRTLIYVINELTKFEPKKINTAILVNRDHSLFPVKINFVGLSLSTSINNHIEVILDKNEMAAYLI
jgi:pyrimidine operon attenuation protein/uracil phosphoribosyltransferase